MSTLFEQVEEIDTRDDLIVFIHSLLRDLHEKPDNWENLDLPMYLDALAAWIECREQRYKNLGKPVPEDLSWSAVGEMLLAPRYYE